LKKLDNFQLLIVIMAITTLIVTAVSVASLYQAAFTQHRLRLVETVQSQARLIEAVARFDDAKNGSDHSINWQADTLKQVVNAHSQFKGFGKTGEYTLARRQGDEIVFELTHRHFDLDKPRPIPFAGKWAQQMRLALSGESGVTIGLDYRGINVLAAFEPIDILGLGLVAKIDLSEIREPFIQAGLIALGVALLAILIASTIFSRITQPIARQIEQQAETFRTLVETVRESIVLIDVNGCIQFVNPSAESLFGYSPGELIGKDVGILMPSTHSAAHGRYVDQYLSTGVGKIIGTGRQLLGVRKDGSRFPMHLSIGDIDLPHTRLFTGVIMDLTEQKQLQREIMDIPVREQRHIGQELHDGLGQQLTGLGMLAASLLNKVSKPEFKLASQLADGIQESLTQLRSLSRGLVPIEVNTENFNVALQNLAKEVEQQTRMRIDLELDDISSLNINSAIMHLYRVAQEAINNAVKHAQADLITVTLKINGDQGELNISDNGLGMSSILMHGDGLGLRIMHHRCSLFDGEFSIRPGDPKGTVVCCRFPVDYNPDNHAG
jgi:two-component system sensor kinase FixL